MNTFQQQFKKHLVILDKIIDIGLSPKQLINLAQNVSEHNFLENLKKNTQAEKIRMRPVKLSFNEKSFITTPLLILRKNNTFTVMIHKNNKNWFVDKNNQLLLVSDFNDIQLALQFYPSVPLTSLKDLVHFLFHSTANDFKKIALICLILVIFASVTPLCFTAMLNAVIPFHDLTLWVQISILLLVIVFITGGFELVKRLFLLQTILKRCEQTQASLWNKLFRFYPEYFSRHSIMDSVLSAQSLDQIRDVIDISVISNFFTLIFSLTMIALLFYYSITLAIIVTIFFLVIIICSYFFYRYINTNLNKAQQIRVTLVQFTLEIFKGIEKIKLANAEHSVLQKWLSVFLDKKKYDVSSNQHFNYMIVVHKYILLCISFCFFYIFTWNFDIIPLDKFVGFTVTYGIITQELIGFTYETYLILIALSLLNRSKIITDEEHVEKQSGIRPIEFKGRIQVEDLSLDVEEQRIVSRVNFEAAPGKTIAIAGLSGSGKTTLLRSLLGLVSYPDQSIIIDDIALEHLNLNWYRMHCGVVLQNSELLNGNILDNITLGDEFAPNEIDELCAKLNLSSWLNELPMKLHTRCMGAHELISGGQKQLILLARALIRKPVFLFLDEATSSLDNISQQAVIKTLQETNATKIIIAHRLETIQWADEILVLDQGKIIEQGKYQQLINKKGKFSELADHQRLLL